MLQWARANGCEWNEGTCSAAAKGGHLEVMQWARANGCPWDRLEVLFIRQRASYYSEYAVCPGMRAWVLAQSE